MTPHFNHPRTNRLRGDDFGSLAFARPLRRDGELSGQLAGDFEKNPTHFGIWILDQDRHALVATFAQGGRNRNFPEIRDLEPFRGSLGSTTRENLMFLAAPIANKVTHIFNDA